MAAVKCTVTSLRTDVTWKGTIIRSSKLVLNSESVKICVFFLMKDFQISFDISASFLFNKSKRFLKLQYIVKKEVLFEKIVGHLYAPFQKI